MPLLATKLFIPPVRLGFVSRPRLSEKLNAALSHNLTLLCAPAGFGKTALISEWVHLNDTSVRAAWVSLEDTENDPPRFWEYVIAALRSAHPIVGSDSLALLHSSQPVPIESTLTALINELCTLIQDAVLVLDDYQFINSDAVHRGVAFVLEHLPPNMHLVIATRVDPPLPLARWRAKGQLIEIGASDLRFDLEEAAELLKTLVTQELSEEELRVVTDRTEGWAVGLKMIALSFANQRDIGRSIGALPGSERYIMDYLIEEVLRQQPAGDVDFLVKTSILERLTGPLCDAVTGKINGREMLSKLERGNLFIVPLDESCEWYRYEHLFADLLRLRLEAQHGKEMAAELRRKASCWCEQSGLLDDAIDYALGAQDWDKAIEIIRNPVVNVPRWHSLTMFRWLDQIPLDLLAANVPLYMNYVWALERVRQLSRAEECLKYLDDRARGDSLLQSRIALVRASIAIDRGHMTLAEEYATEALSLQGAEHASSLSIDDLGDRATGSLLLASIRMQQARLAEAEPLLREALDLFRQLGSTPLTIQPLTSLADVAAARGRLHEAGRAYQEAIEVAAGDPIRAIGHLGLGDVHYEWNESQAAAYHQGRAIELLQLSQRPRYLTVAYLRSALTRMAMSDTDGAAEALANADRLASGIPSELARCAAYHVAIALSMKDAESVSQWADRLAALEDSIPPDVPARSLRLLLVRKGKGAAAARVKAEQEKVERQNLEGSLITLLIGQALDSSDTGDAVEFMARAMAMGKTEGYVRTFVDWGMNLAPLLRRAIHQGIEPGYARKLLETIEAEEWRRVKVKGVEAPRPSVLPEPLSERELEVLCLLAADASNKQIAARLCISLSTAKTHVHHILDKLGTKNRTLAIAKAKELKLI